MLSRQSTRRIEHTVMACFIIQSKHLALIDYWLTNLINKCLHYGHSIACVWFFKLTIQGRFPFRSYSDPSLKCWKFNLNIYRNSCVEVLQSCACKEYVRTPLLTLYYYYYYYVFFVNIFIMNLYSRCMIDIRGLITAELECCCRRLLYTSVD